MEDQLSALGLVLNCIVLWNTVYMDRALAELRAQGYPVLVEDVLAGRDRPLHWAISRTSHIRPIFPPYYGDPYLDIEGVPDPNTSPGSTPTPSGLTNGPVSAASPIRNPPPRRQFW